jgi:hypothetical protein
MFWSKKTTNPKVKLASSSKDPRSQTNQQNQPEKKTTVSDCGWAPPVDTGFVYYEEK